MTLPGGLLRAAIFDRRFAFAGGWNGERIPDSHHGADANAVLAASLRMPTPPSRRVSGSAASVASGSAASVASGMVGRPRRFPSARAKPADPLLDYRTLELREDARHLEERLACWRRQGPPDAMQEQIGLLPVQWTAS